MHMKPSVFTSSTRPRVLMKHLIRFLISRGSTTDKACRIPDQIFQLRNCDVFNVVRALAPLIVHCRQLTHLREKCSLLLTSSSLSAFLQTRFAHQWRRHVTSPMGKNRFVIPPASGQESACCYVHDICLDNNLCLPQVRVFGMDSSYLLPKIDHKRYLGSQQHSPTL